MFEKTLAIFLVSISSKIILVLITDSHQFLNKREDACNLYLTYVVISYSEISSAAQSLI